MSQIAELQGSLFAGEQVKKARDAELKKAKDAKAEADRLEKKRIKDEEAAAAKLLREQLASAGGLENEIKALVKKIAEEEKAIEAKQLEMEKKYPYVEPTYNEETEEWEGVDVSDAEQAAWDAFAEEMEPRYITLYDEWYTQLQ
jgi:hypothetical protein